MSDESSNQQLAVREPKAELTAGSSIAALVPTNIEQAYRLATAMHASGLAPSSLGSVEKVLVAIMAGAELGLPPFQSVQSFAVISNRPTIWGDGMLAVVRSRGCAVKEWSEGEDDLRVAWCEVTRPDSGEVVKRDFSVADAKKANLWGKSGPWQTNPKRMLQMRARAFALRDACADILRGFQMREEVEDYQVIREARPQVSDLRERLEAQSGDRTEGFTAENGEHETPEDVLAEVELPVTNTEALNDRPTRHRRTKAEMAAARAADARDSQSTETVTDASFEPAEAGASPAEGDSPARPTETASAPTAEALPVSLDSATPASTPSAVATSSPAPQAELSLGGAEDDGAAFEELAEQEIEQAETDIVLEALDEMAAEEPSAITVFINTVAQSETWIGGKTAMIKLMQSDAWPSAQPHEQRGARQALWAIPARVRDKVDPGQDPTAFLCWSESAPDEDQIDGTLMVLEGSAIWTRMSPAQHEKIRGAAAQAKRRIADVGAVE